MSIWIDADALMERWNKMSVRGRTEFDQEIMCTPSIDIVRCKECKWWIVAMDENNSDEDYLKCSMDKWPNADDFCSYGEIKESE